MTEIYRQMTLYNRWMNERLMATCSLVSDADRKQNRGAPFGSIHGLWNHILLADRLWLSRFEGAGGRFLAPPVATLGDELFSDWEELKVERARTDDGIDGYVASLTDEKLARALRYTSFVNPAPHEVPLSVAVQHFFNHQTHHRGQITALMEQAGLDCGVTDLLALPKR